VRRALLRLARALLVAWALSAVALFALQRHLVFAAPTELVPPRATGASLLSVRTPAGWNVAALHWSAPGGARTVVHFHGNGEQLAWQVDLGEALHRAGYGVVAAEYPGYGVMGAVAPTEASLYAAAEALLRHLEGPLAIPRERIVLQGFSLGTGVASEMARRGFGSRLVLIAPYTSMRDMGARQVPWLPARWLVRDPFDTYERAPAIRLPTLLLHGADDDLIPPAMSAALARRFPNARRVLLPRTHHNDVFARSMLEVVDALRRFAPPR
jgi:alpha-beta hydrolase superfamily lysophospholipase